MSASQARSYSPWETSPGRLRAKSWGRLQPSRELQSEATAQGMRLPRADFARSQGRESTLSPELRDYDASDLE